MYLYGIEITFKGKTGADWYVLIVPLWNWNWKRNQDWPNLECSNCTFMELKWNIRLNSLVNGSRSNCTFMELKLYKVGVPLWGSKSSNCTFMELKLSNCLSVDIRHLCSNCTFMELKWQNSSMIVPTRSF